MNLWCVFVRTLLWYIALHTMTYLVCHLLNLNLHTMPYLARLHFCVYLKKYKTYIVFFVFSSYVIRITIYFFRAFTKFHAVRG